MQISNRKSEQIQCFTQALKDLQNLDKQQENNNISKLLAKNFSSMNENFIGFKLEDNIPEEESQLSSSLSDKS